MLLNCRATHVCWVIWGAEFDADIHFYIWTEEWSPSGQKFGQVRSNFKVQNVLTKICLSCAVLYKDSKNVIHFLGTAIRNAKNVFPKMWCHLYLVFSHWTARKQDIFLKLCVSDGCMYLDRIYSGFLDKLKNRKYQKFDITIL